MGVDGPLTGGDYSPFMDDLLKMRTWLWYCCLTSVPLWAGVGCSEEAEPEAKSIPAMKIQPAIPVESWPMFHGSSDLRGLAEGPLGDRFEVAWAHHATEAITSSPIVVGDLVVVGSDDGQVIAVDRNSGERRWSFATQGKIEAAPLFVHDLIVIGSADFNVYGLDVNTGERRWTFETGEKVVGSAIRYRENEIDDWSVIFGSHDNFVYCLNASDGREKWKYETASYVNATPALSKHSIMIGGCDSALHIVDARTGEGRVALTLTAEEYIAGAGAFVDGMAYFGHYGNAFVAVNIGAGTITWQFAESRFPFYATPAVTDDQVVTAGRDKKVYCFDRTSGEVLWSKATRRGIDSSPVVCDGKVVVGTGQGLLLVLDLETGDEIWTWDLGEPIISSPAVVDGQIYIGCNDGGLYAFKEIEPSPTDEN